MESRGRGRLTDREGRLRQDRVRGARPGGVLAAEIRRRRAPCPARPEDRGAGSNSHVSGDGVGAAGGGPRGGRAQTRRPWYQSLDVDRSWWAERQQDLLGD